MGAQWWEQHGYLAGKEIGGGLWLCVAPMITTRRLMVCDPGFVHEFWCYPYDTVPLGYVLAAFEDFDGRGDPAPGWMKHFPSERRHERVEVGWPPTAPVSEPMGELGGHLGSHVWRNGAELVWECADQCPHPSHERDDEGVGWPPAR